MKKIILYVVLCFIATFLFGCDFFAPENINYSYKAKIIAVVDGDTVKVRFDDLIPNDCSRTETVLLVQRKKEKGESCGL